MKNLIIFLGFKSLIGYARLMILFLVGVFVFYWPKTASKAPIPQTTSAAKVIHLNANTTQEQCTHLISKMHAKEENGIMIYKPKSQEQRNEVLLYQDCFTKTK